MSDAGSNTSIKFGGGYEAPWTTIYGSPIEQRDQLIEAFALSFDQEPTLAQVVVEASKTAQGLYQGAATLGGSSQQQKPTWSRGGSGNSGGGQQQAPRQQGGGMVPRQGVSAKGEWRGWAKAARGPIDTFADKGTADWDAIGAALGLN